MSRAAAAASPPTCAWIDEMSGRPNARWIVSACGKAEVGVATPRAAAACTASLVGSPPAAPGRCWTTASPPARACRGRCPLPEMACVHGCDETATLGCVIGIVVPSVPSMLRVRSTLPNRGTSPEMGEMGWVTDVRGGPSTAAVVKQSCNDLGRAAHRGSLCPNFTTGAARAQRRAQRTPRRSARALPR